MLFRLFICLIFSTPALAQYEHYETFWENGATQISGQLRDERKFGIFEFYNKKGKLTGREDYNKNKPVNVKDIYRTKRHLKGLPYYKRIKKRKKIILSNLDDQKRKLKRGALCYIKFMSKDSIYRHCLISGFINDTLVISKFNYDLSTNRSTLKFDSVFLAPLSKISEFNLLKHNEDARETLAIGLFSAGSVLIVEPLLLFPIFSGPGALAMPITYAFVSTGLLSCTLSLKLKNKLSTQRYNVLKYDGNTYVRPMSLNLD